MSTDDAIDRFNAACADPLGSTIERLEAEAARLSDLAGSQRLKLAAAQDEVAALQARFDLAVEQQRDAVHHMEAAREQRDAAQAEAASLRERTRPATPEEIEAQRKSYAEGYTSGPRQARLTASSSTDGVTQPRILATLDDLRYQVVALVASDRERVRKVVMSDLFGPQVGEVPAGAVVHDLKVWPEYYRHLASGEKTYELRKNDRGYQTGHWLRLREWSRDDGYSGREMLRLVTYVSRGSWLADGYVALALGPARALQATPPPAGDRGHASRLIGLAARLVRLVPADHEPDHLIPREPVVDVAMSMREIADDIKRQATPLPDEPFSWWGDRSVAPSWAEEALDALNRWDAAEDEGGDAQAEAVAILWRLHDRIRGATPPSPPVGEDRSDPPTDWKSLYRRARETADRRGGWLDEWREWAAEHAPRPYPLGMKGDTDKAHREAIDAVLASAAPPASHLRALLAEVAEQLRTWATESRVGGWSTHQVDPQRQLADKIDGALAAAAPPVPEGAGLLAMASWCEERMARERRAATMVTGGRAARVAESHAEVWEACMYEARRRASEATPPGEHEGEVSGE